MWTACKISVLMEIRRVIPVTLCVLTSYLHMKNATIDTGEQTVVWMENRWPQAFIIGKQHDGVVLLLPRFRSMSCWVKRVHLWRTGMSYWSVTFIYCDEPFIWASVLLGSCSPSRQRWEMQTLPIFFTPRYEILSGVLTIAVCASAGIWQLLKYRAEVGTQTNGGLGEYREAELKLRGYTFAWGHRRNFPSEDFWKGHVWKCLIIC